MALQISDGQKAKIKELNDQFDNRQLDVFRDKSRGEETKKALASITEQREKELMNLLSEPQKQQFRELKGARLDLSQVSEK